MSRFEFMGTVNEGGHEYALVFDSETGYTKKSPIVDQSNGATAPPAVKEDPRRRKPKAIINAPSVYVPPVELQKFDEQSQQVEESQETVVIEPEKAKNPFATANPRFAWQDPEWEHPSKRKRQPPPIHQTLGADADKIFREPGKYGDDKIDFTHTN